MKELCLIRKIGNCKGCPVQSLTAEKMAKAETEQREKIIKEIGRQFCPAGEAMQTPNLPNRKIW